MNKEIITIEKKETKNMNDLANNSNDRLDTHHERMNIISDNLKKTHTVACANNEMLKKIIKHFGIE